MRAALAFAVALPALALAVVAHRRARTLRAQDDAREEAFRVYRAMGGQHVRLDTEPIGAPHTRDMGAAALDVARARLLNPQAEEKELELATMRKAPEADGPPFLAEGWAVVSDPERKLITAIGRDQLGRQQTAVTKSDNALWLAGALIAAARQCAEQGPR